MSIKFNAAGSKRKALVMAIGEILGKEAVYDGAPTFSYTVGDCKIDREGALSYSADARTAQIVRLLAGLKERGYEAAEVPDDIAVEDDRALAVEVPKAGFSDEALENLRKIITGKQGLIKKALGVDRLPLEVSEDKLRFPWFVLSGIDGEADAYTRFVCALCAMAKKQKRVTAKEQETENDKLTMRLFLIRLGFVGPDTKPARKILLRNLTGNSAWKSGRRPERAAAAEGNPDAEPTSGNSTATNRAEEPAEVLADARLIHEANASFVPGNKEAANHEV